MVLRQRRPRVWSGNLNPVGKLRKRGFTLLETSMALVIIGVGVLAFVDAQTAFQNNNGWSSQAATGAYLANEIREYSRHFPKHDKTSGGIWVEDGAGGKVLKGWGPESSETSLDLYDDCDDLDGKVFGSTGTMPGPIDAAGNVITQIGLDAEIKKDSDNKAVALQGWTQTVTVEKVDPFNWSLPRPGTYEIAANGSYKGLKVNDFPLRMTVTVSYQGVYDTSAQEVTRLVWIVP